MTLRQWLRSDWWLFVTIMAWAISLIILMAIVFADTDAWILWLILALMIWTSISTLIWLYQIIQRAAQAAQDE